MPWVIAFSASIRAITASRSGRRRIASAKRNSSGAIAVTRLWQHQAQPRRHAMVSAAARARDMVVIAMERARHGASRTAPWSPRDRSRDRTAPWRPAPTATAATACRPGRARRAPSPWRSWRAARRASARPCDRPGVRARSPRGRGSRRGGDRRRPADRRAGPASPRSPGPRHLSEIELGLGGIGDQAGILHGAIESRAQGDLAILGNVRRRDVWFAHVGGREHELERLPRRWVRRPATSASAHQAARDGDVSRIAAEHRPCAAASQSACCDFTLVQPRPQRESTSPRSSARSVCAPS